jgi:hypothetical protein
MRVCFVKSSVFFCLTLLLGAQILWGQATNTGVITGTISDQSGAVITGATVTLTDPATGTARTATTNSAGHYVFVDVTPATYTVTITKQGFATTKAPSLQVQVGQTTSFNASLQVGGTSVEVQVSATGTELQTMNSTVGNTVSGLALSSLPSIGRDVSTFVELQPGVSPDGSVAGAVVDQSHFSLDGGNNSNDMDGSMSVYTTTFAGDPTGGIANEGYGVAAGPTGVMPTPADSVEEFKVNTANQTADFNSSAGAEVKVVTKRGTNAWHGTGYEYYRDNNWSANSWDNNFNKTPLPAFHYSRFGGAIGGPIIPKDILGGKTYFFGNYEGFRYPNSETIFRNVPSPALRLGLIIDPNSKQVYNLNPTAVTYNGTTYAGTGRTLDPRGIGINPLVQQMWNKYEPASNAACTNSLCDGTNVLGFNGNLAIKQTSNFGVARLDHDFSPNWHFMASYRLYDLRNATDDQVDIGGFFQGDKLGVPTSLSGDPQIPWYLVLGLTTNISSNITNDFHYSFLRNWWAWNREGDTIQLAGLGGALEPFAGESRSQDLLPYNVNTQQTRTRFWDGHDNFFRDDISMLKGNHLFQFGGSYQHNWNYHQRTDNGGGINYQPVYQLGLGSAGSGLGTPPAMCSTFTDSSACGALYAATLGIVSQAQIAYTRAGNNLALNPPLTPAFDQSTIPYYNVYFSDTWHVKPTFTLTYGLGWALEMPPVETAGKQVELVDQVGQSISAETYLHQRENAALKGQVYNPEVGFALVGNTANGLKYPYNPYYGGFSPRIAAAWNPHFDPDSTAGKIFGHDDTVVRGGYGRFYGRLNGVDLVLAPLLGVGLIQPVTCRNNTSNNAIAGGAGGNCASTAPTSATAFRVGVDGPNAPIPAASPTLPQPVFPGFNNIAASGSLESLDPNFRPNSVDSFDLTIQRQLTKRVTLEVGYIGRLIHHEYQPTNINAVPYMMTLGGQQFAQAYKNVVMQYCGGFAGLAGGGCAANVALKNITPQPFFEAALKGTGYCNQKNGTPYSSCTAAVVDKEGANGTGNLTNASVWSLWSDLDAGGFNFAPTMLNTPFNCPTGAQLGCNGQLTSGVAINASIGHGNYNSGFATLKMNDWKGITLQQNFTYSKALGTGALVQATSQYTEDDPYNLNLMYGRQAYDRKFVYNMFIVYQPPFYRGQNGFKGRLLGGWTFAPVFTAGSGEPIEVFTSTGDGQEFGGADNIEFFGNQNAIPMGPIPGGSGKAHYFPNGIASGPGSGGEPISIFGNPAAAFNDFRNPILGLDTKRDGGYGILNGLNYWNMDFSVKKNIKITERFNTEFQAVFLNIFNHNQFLDPWGMGMFSSGTFGNLFNTNPNTGVTAEQREIQLGIRVNF